MKTRNSVWQCGRVMAPIIVGCLLFLMSGGLARMSLLREARTMTCSTPRSR